MAKCKSLLAAKGKVNYIAGDLSVEEERIKVWEVGIGLHGCSLQILLCTMI